MRVIGGELRRRLLKAPEGLATRPTSDRLRETLFNVLAARSGGVGLGGVRVLDLYAGSGAVGIEALSRGAREAVFVERGPAALKALRENIENLGLGGRARVQAAGVASFLRSRMGSFDVVFLDPPYEQAGEYAATLGLLGGSAVGMLAEGALVVAEHRRKEGLAAGYGRLSRTRLLEQGDAGLSFYEAGRAEWGSGPEAQ
jgi:16S rRNA (guanine(966)-N(2))-methyltransferase RsmD